MAVSDWIEELRQRRVLRTLLAYGVVVFAILQVIEPVLHGLGLPDWSLTAVVIGLAIGFPVVGLIEWLLDAQRRPASPRAHAANVRNRRLALGLGALALAVAVVTGVVLYRSRTVGLPAAGPPSIAVLPFVNLSEDPDQDYFADGLTEEIQGALAQIAGLRVIGRTSSFTFKGKAMDLNEVARKLGVTSVLEGSVRRAGSRLRINAQIVDTRDGYHLGSRSYEREIGDVFAIQDEIGRAVAQALQLTLLPRNRGVERRPTSPEATIKYLLARHFLTRSSLDNFVRAAAASEEAIALAPDFAPGWATLAAPNGGIADRTEAPNELRTATGLDPLFASAWISLGILQVAIGNGGEGERTLERVLELDPQSDYARQGLGVRHLLLAGRPEAALAEFARCEDPMWRLWGTALAQHDLGRAEASSAALMELAARFAAPSPYQVAQVHAWRGEREEAFAWLETAWKGHDSGLLLLQWDPLLRYLRGDPRFGTFQRRMNLPAG